jgi:hypothetical protein
MAKKVGLLTKSELARVVPLARMPVIGPFVVFDEGCRAMLKELIHRAKPRRNEVCGIDPFLAFRKHDLGNFADQVHDNAHPAIRCPDSGTRPYSRISHGMPTEPFPHEQHFEEAWGER